MISKEKDNNNKMQKKFDHKVVSFYNATHPVLCVWGEEVRFSCASLCPEIKELGIDFEWAQASEGQG